MQEEDEKLWSSKSQISVICNAEKFFGEVIVFEFIWLKLMIEVFDSK